MRDILPVDMRARPCTDNLDVQPGCSTWPDDFNHDDDTRLMPPPAQPSDDSPQGSSLECHVSEDFTWSYTPHEVLINVFKHLDDPDRCSASLVCKKWLQISRAACLWRRRRFVFAGADAVERLQHYKMFITLLGQHVHHVVLDFGRPSMSTAGIIAKAFEGFVSKVNSKVRMRLQSVTARNLDFQMAWRFFSHHRGKVIRSLCMLFKRQAYLRSANLAFCQLNKDEGIRILESLALTGSLHRHHKEFLSVMDLQEFFSSRTRVLSSSKFADTMGLFFSLTTLCMDKRYLNEAVLEKLTSRTYGAPLRFLQLVVDSLDPVLDHPISRKSWCEAVHRNPGFTVGVLFLGLSSHDKYANILVRGMPLSWLRLSWLGVVGPVHPTLLVDVEKLLRHVTCCFSDTITCVHVCLWPEAVVPVDVALVNMVSQCQRLQELIVTCRIVPETLDKIEAVLAARQENVLQTMELRVAGFTAEMASQAYIRQRWPRIRTIKMYD